MSQNGIWEGSVFGILGISILGFLYWEYPDPGGSMWWNPVLHKPKVGLFMIALLILLNGIFVDVV